MAYILYSFILLALVVGTVLYVTRTHWTPFLPSLAGYLPSSLGRYARVSTFSDDIENGFSSSSFDLSANVAAGDSRAGLDEAGKREVQRIMKKKRVDFDEARRIWMQERFKREGIGADGRPRDPKFVSFS